MFKKAIQFADGVMDWIIGGNENPSCWKNGYMGIDPVRPGEINDVKEFFEGNKLC